jgi:hypothetical protein
MAKGPNERMSEAEKVRFEELYQEYIGHAHGVQSGIAMRTELDQTFATPKDMRTGIDTSKADMGGLVELLIQKGVFTDIEYMEAIVTSMGQERARWEKDIGEFLGRKVTLG